MENARKMVLVPGDGVVQFQQIKSSQTQGEIDEFIVDNVPAKFKRTPTSLLKSLRVDG